jgi:hypothetical protein
MPFEKLLPMSTAIPTLLPPADAARVNFFARQRSSAQPQRWLAPHSLGVSHLSPKTVRALPLFFHFLS